MLFFIALQVPFYSRKSPESRLHNGKKDVLLMLPKVMCDLQWKSSNFKVLLLRLSYNQL